MRSSTPNDDGSKAESGFRAVVEFEDSAPRHHIAKVDRR